MTKPASKWQEWLHWTTKLYKETGLMGIPLGEFKKHYEAGYTPKAACDIAVSKRKPRPPKPAPTLKDIKPW